MSQSSSQIGSLEGFEQYFDFVAAASEELPTAGPSYPPSALWESSINDNYLGRDDATKYHTFNQAPEISVTAEYEYNSSGSPFSSPQSQYNLSHSSLQSTPSGVFSSNTVDSVSLPDTDVYYNSRIMENFSLQSPDFLTDDMELYEDEVPTNEVPEAQPYVPEEELLALALNSPSPEADASGSNPPQHPDADANASFVRRSTRVSAYPAQVPKYRELDDTDPDEPAVDRPTKLSPRNLRRKNDDDNYDADSDSEDETSTARTLKRPPSRVAAKKKSRREVFRCRFAHCTMTFGRKNDAERHSLRTAAHKEDRQREQERGNMELPPSSSCLKCGKALSRPDAQKRHERDGSCKKVKGDATKF